MKKIFLVLAVAAVCAVSSCGNKQTNNPEEAADSVAAVVEDNATELVSAINEAIEANDAAMLEDALKNVDEQLSVLDDAEGADVLAKVQECLKSNADAVKALTEGKTEALTLVDKLNTMKAADIPTLKQIETSGKEAVEGAVNDVKNNAVEKANEIKGAVDQKVEEVKQAPQKAVDQVKESTGKAIDGAANAAKQKLGL